MQALAQIDTTLFSQMAWHFNWQLGSTENHVFPHINFIDEELSPAVALANSAQHNVQLSLLLDIDSCLCSFFSDADDRDDDSLSNLN